MPSSSIKSKKDLIEEIGIALNSHGMEEKFFLDLTIQDIVPYPEDILVPGYRYNEFETSLSKEEIQEVRKKHRLIEIDAIPSYIGYGIMENFAEQHDNEWLFRALKNSIRSPCSAMPWNERTFSTNGMHSEMKNTEYRLKNGLMTTVSILSMVKSFN